MTMPIRLVLVRHGESEGNFANARSRKGDNSLFTPEHTDRHDCAWRLTDSGICQAKAAGAWIRSNYNNGGMFDRHFVSVYVRAMETAAHLDLPNADWCMTLHLRERDWGDFTFKTDEERRTSFAENLERRRMSALFWEPPNGESIANVCETRVFRMLDTLHRECSDKRVIMVLHGDLMMAFRIVLEHLSPQQFAEIDCSRDPLDRIHNGQVIEYTRRNPETGRLDHACRWMRSVNPTDLSTSRNVWQPIAGETYSNAQLLALAQRSPRYISG
jgi:broad specificity phosphatase PhoE